MIPYHKLQINSTAYFMILYNFTFYISLFCLFETYFYIWCKVSNLTLFLKTPLNLPYMYGKLIKYDKANTWVKKKSTAFKQLKYWEEGFILRFISFSAFMEWSKCCWCFSEESRS